MKTVSAFTLGIVITVSFFICLGFSDSANNTKVSQYKIVEAENRIQDLERKVQSEIDSGWTPIGGLSVSELPRGTGTIVYLHQAVVK
ncbi:hypothetical protein P4C99_19995 [Pontiellaceae bacterium B1224]|nr:hypothetical protein [Pontiellaceae bacterium B1224]